MGFNWVGAAKGVDNALAEQVRRQVEQQKLALEVQQTQGQIENQRLQREINQQNADSLADSRKAATSERERKAQREKQMGEWATSVVGKYTAPDAQPPQNWQDALELARAKNIMATGEDLPDSAISQIVSSYSKNPNDRLLTKEEFDQAVALDRAKAKNSAAYRAPSSAEEDRQMRREAMKDTNDFIAWLLQSDPMNPTHDIDIALQRFDANPGVVMQKTKGLVTIADARKMLEYAKGKPMTAEEKIKAAAAAAMAGKANVAGTGEKR